MAKIGSEAVTGPEMLSARERRAQRQKELLESGAGCVVSLTMNIPGAVKFTPLIRDGFYAGTDLLRQLLVNLGTPILREEETLEKTGCEALLLVDGDAAEVKKAAVQLEEAAPLGRLLDIDVISLDGKVLSRSDLGLPPRCCLICGGPAHACARSQSHSYDALRNKTDHILRTHLEGERADRISALAARSMLHEVLVTPKPGLVDRANSGAHSDMDVFSFASSAAALAPYFRRAYLLGRQKENPADLLAGLRGAGRLAEEEMYRVTGGVNTHKGLIFSLGLICGALGRCEAEATKDLNCLFQQCIALAEMVVNADFQKNSQTDQSAGMTLYRSLGIRGIRGEAAAGFPTVRNVGLPVLTALLKRGYRRNDAGVYTLIALLANTEDTNLIARGGVEKAASVAETVRQIWPWEGAPEDLPSMEHILALDADLIRQNLSPGGCADLLALSFFLHDLQKEEWNNIVSD